MMHLIALRITTTRVELSIGAWNFYWKNRTGHEADLIDAPPILNLFQQDKSITSASLQACLVWDLQPYWMYSHWNNASPASQSIIICSSNILITFRPPVQWRSRVVPEVLRYPTKATSQGMSSLVVMNWVGRGCCLQRHVKDKAPKLYHHWACVVLPCKGRVIPLTIRLAKPEAL